MARIDPIPLDRMTPDQRRLNDAIAATRSGGVAKGPFALWLRTPELADHANAFGSYLRHGTSVPQRLVELAVLVVARNGMRTRNTSRRRGSIRPSSKRSAPARSRSSSRTTRRSCMRSPPS